MVARSNHTINGIPSDLIIGEVKESKRLKTSSDSAFSSAIQNGTGYGSSLKITIPAGAEYSLKLIGNTEHIIRYVKGDGVFIEYYDGQELGDLVAMTGAYPLNNISDEGHQFLLEVYDEHPTGNRIISGYGIVNTPYFTMGTVVFEIANPSNSDVTTFISVGFEAIGEKSEPFALLAGTQLIGTTEMSQYNGIN